MERYGILRIDKDLAYGLVLTTDAAVMTQVRRSAKTKGLLGEAVDDATVLIHPSERGYFKQVLLKLGLAGSRDAGYVDGEAHQIDLDLDDRQLRPYQELAAESPWEGDQGRRRRAARARRSSVRRRWRRPMPPRRG